MTIKARRQKWEAVKADPQYPFVLQDGFGIENEDGEYLGMIREVLVAAKALDSHKDDAGRVLLRFGVEPYAYIERYPDEIDLMTRTPVGGCILVAPWDYEK